MATNKIWRVKFVAGDPERFNAVRSSHWLRKSEAIARFGDMVINNPKWRFWIERENGDRLMESDAEKQWRERSQ